MFAACLKSFGQLSPRTDGMMPAAAALRFALSPTHRMVNRIHGHATNVRASSQPSSAPRFATRDVHMIHISNLPDGGITAVVNSADFPGRKFDERISSFAVAQRRLLTSATCNLAAATGRNLYVMNVRA